MRVKVILVHTGTIFPEYLNDCVYQLLKFNIDVHLILSKSLHSNIRYDQITLLPSEDYEDYNYKTFRIKHKDFQFRDNFWQRTSSRFFLIHNYVLMNGIKNFFHIENDVLLYTDLSKENEILEKLNYEMNIVIDSNHRCIPSIIWFEDSKILSSLTQFIYSNSHNNDMKNIFDFYLNNRDKVDNLPILPSNNSLRYETNLDYSNNFNLFNSIFDAAAIGQYIGGIHTDEDSIGYVSPDSIFDVSNYTYKWENEMPYMIYGNLKVKINNLHIHSKKLNKTINK